MIALYIAKDQTFLFADSKDFVDHSVSDAQADLRLRLAHIILAQSDQSLRCALNPSFLHEDSEDSDQTGRMPRLIRVFAVRTCHFLVLS